MPHPNFYRPTFATIDLNAIKMNILNLQLHLKSNVDVIAVVKANAYGHGAVEVSQTAMLAGARMLAVATPDEAIRLREQGIESPLLVLGASPPVFAKVAADHDIIVTIFNEEWLNKVPLLAKPLKVHLKFDTGMGRLGLDSEAEIKSFLQVIKNRSDILIDGVFTHFSTADEEDDEYYKQQISKFKHFLTLFQDKPRLVHAANSAAALVHSDSVFDAVRFGISLYGLAPSFHVNSKLPFPLDKALSLQTELVNVKRVKKSTPISYGASYVADQEEWIGTLPIGYADGFLRGLRGQEVLVRGKRHPVIGRICMDQCMIRLDEEMPIGEKVVLLGRQGQEEIHIDEWSQRLQTINYEIPCLLSERVPRVYTP
jgi:alanine racemase